MTQNRWYSSSSTKIYRLFNTDITLPGDAFKDEGISVQEFFSLMLGMEYGVTPRFSLIGQFRYLTRPFEDLGTPVLDRRIFEILVGVDYRTDSAWFIQGGILEDIIDSIDAGADVSLILNFGKYF